MELLASNLKTLLGNQGKNLEQFLEENKVNKVSELTLGDLEIFCFNEHIKLDNLLFYNLSVDRSRLKKLKLIILDVDGVLTDGGMYYTQRGDEIKKYNTKDGMAILEAKKHGVEFGIISSGFKMEIVKARADTLKIDNLYVGREPKMNILNAWCKRLDIELSEIGIIGDDINDLEVMRNVGFSAAPSNAIPVVKKQVDLVLQKGGGEGCVREFIDHYLLDQPLTR